MTANFAISLVGRPAQVGRPRSCAPAAVSAIAWPCQRRQIKGKLHLNLGYPVIPGSKSEATSLREPRGPGAKR